MRFNIISNLTNGAGLQRDYLILNGHLEAKGHVVTGVMFDAEPPYPSADVNIWLEILPSPSWGLKDVALSAAPRNWVFPNPEWWYADVWDRYLPCFEKVLCKTEDCRRIFQGKVGNRATYIGFEAKDLYEPTIERKPTFLHMAGKSETKNTAAVMEAWDKFNLPPLTAVAFKPSIADRCRGVRNVTHIDRVSEDHLKRMMNENLFHIMPSKYEGFGHYIHEAIGCGGIVLTTDAAPTNRFSGIAKECLIQPSGSFRMREADAHMVDPKVIAETVKVAMGLSEQRRKEISATARKSFLSDRESFRAAFGELV